MQKKVISNNLVPGDGDIVEQLETSTSDELLELFRTARSADFKTLSEFFF